MAKTPPHFVRRALMKKGVYGIAFFINLIRHKKGAPCDAPKGEPAFLRESEGSAYTEHGAGTARHFPQGSRILAQL